MNIKEAIEKLEELSTYDYVKLEEGDIAIDTVLAELEKKDKLIEYWKNGFERELEANRSNIIEIVEQDSIIRKKDKIINLMAEQLTTDIHSKEWVIDYYEREVEK